MKIKSVYAQEIIESRCNPTVVAVTILEDGSEEWAAISSGVSIGQNEAMDQAR